MSSPVTFIRTSLGLAFIFAFGMPQIITSTIPAIAQTNTPVITTPTQPTQTNIIFVSPNGLDTNLGISENQPLRSLTAAINKKPPIGTIIQLDKGNYTVETGEKFPIKIPNGVTVRGNTTNQGKDIIISGGSVFISPTFARQNIALLAGNNSRIEGITITNANTRGYALWVESAQNVMIANNTFTKSNHDGVFLTGNTTADVISNIFFRNGANGISALGTSSGKIQTNTFYDTGFGLTIGQKSQVLVLANRIINNRGGIVVSNIATPTLRNNLIANNLENGLVILRDRKGQPTVDLGSANSLGQNIFQNNKQADINNASGVKLIAIGNQVNPKCTEGEIDLLIPQTPLTAPITPEPVKPIEVVKPASKATGSANNVKQPKPPAAKSTVNESCPAKLPTVTPAKPSAPPSKPATKSKSIEAALPKF